MKNSTFSVTLKAGEWCPIVLKNSLISDYDFEALIRWNATVKASSNIVFYMRNLTHNSDPEFNSITFYYPVTGNLSYQLLSNQDTSIIIVHKDTLADNETVNFFYSSAYKAIIFSIGIVFASLVSVFIF